MYTAFASCNEWCVSSTNRSTTPDPALVYASIYAASVTIHPIYNRSYLAVLAKEKRLYKNDTSMRFTYPIDDKIEGRHYSSSSRPRHLPFKFDEKKCHVPRIHIFNSRSAFALQQTATTYTYHSCISHLPLPLPRLPSHHRRDTQSNVDWLVPR